MAVSALTRTQARRELKDLAAAIAEHDRCPTGRLDRTPRQDVRKLAESLGAHPAASVSSQTDYVIADQEPPPSFAAPGDWA